MEINVFSNREDGEHKLLIHHLSDAYDTVSNKVAETYTSIASKDLNENVETAKKVAVESFEKVKEGISTVATKENLEVVKNKTVEGAVVAKDAIVGASAVVYQTVSQVDYKKNYEDAKNAVGDLWNSLW
jgi:phage tail tape-measure protein